MQNKLDMLFQPSRVIRRPNHSMLNTPHSTSATTKQGLMIQKPSPLPSILGQIVEVKLSSGDMIAFMENSLG